MTRDADVLVVGAGPTGLTLAHGLLRRGVRVRLVDAADGPAATSRALATHARTLEVYDQMGVLGDILPRGRAVRKFSVHQSGRRLAALGADYSRLPTRFPMTVMVDQVITEEALRDAVERLGTAVEWGVRLTGITQDAGAVTAALDGPDGRATSVTVPWLVGCDGGHSTVRRQLGLTLTGDSTETWLIADAALDTDLDDRSLHWLRSRESALMAVPFPTPGTWRLLDTTGAAHGTDDPEAVAARFAHRLTEAVGRPVRVERLDWTSVFTIQQRMIDRMREGRCFVAGDAAHVHSPASGQGMNTGIQDAYNLAWKLAEVVHGRAAEALLDTYSAERVPVGAELLSSTNRATTMIQMRSRSVAALLPVMFQAVSLLPPLQRRISRKIMRAMSALDLTYGGGASDPAGEHAQPLGHRVCRFDAREADLPAFAALAGELRDVRWSVLAADGPGSGADAWQETARRHAESLSVRLVTDPGGGGAPFGDGGGGAVPLPDAGGLLRERLGLAPCTWLLVRPDGYAAARGTRPAALDAALRKASGGAGVDAAAGAAGAR